MVNLRAAANLVTRGINPNVRCELWHSTGSTTAASGKRAPTYSKLPIYVQAQALSYSDLQQLDGLNIQGVRRAIYANSQVMSIVRVQQQGGDLLVFPSGTFPEGTTWLAAHVLERWLQWCKVAITLQVDQLTPFV
jgi:hypothetical protein